MIVKSKIMKLAKEIVLYWVVALTSFEVAANDVDDNRAFTPPEIYEGNFLFFEDIPNTLFLIGEVEQQSELKFRRALREHEIEKLVLLSPGGDVDAGLSIASIVNDRKIATYVPALPVVSEDFQTVAPETLGCMSACAFIYFGGVERYIHGEVGIHQIRTSIPEEQLDGVEVSLRQAMEHFEASSQSSVAEIISTLNTFNVPPEIYVYMFDSLDMYFLNEKQKKAMSTGELLTWHEIVDRRVDDYFSQLELHFVEQVQTDGSTSYSERGRTTESDRLLVKKIQTLLNEHGCKAGIVDGVFGGNTQEAIFRFAKSVNITVDEIKNIQTDEFIELLVNTHRPSCSSEVETVRYLPFPYGDLFLEEEIGLIGFWNLEETCEDGTGGKVSASILEPRREYFSPFGTYAQEYGFYILMNGFLYQGLLYEKVNSSQIAIRWKNGTSNMNDYARRYNGMVDSTRHGFTLNAGDCFLEGKRVRGGESLYGQPSNVAFERLYGMPYRAVEEMAEIQRALNTRNCEAGIPDGVRDIDTDEAIRRYEKASGLEGVYIDFPLGLIASVVGRTKLTAMCSDGFGFTPDNPVAGNPVR